MSYLRNISDTLHLAASDVNVASEYICMYTLIDDEDLIMIKLSSSYILTVDR